MDVDPFNIGGGISQFLRKHSKLLDKTFPVLLFCNDLVDQKRGGKD